MKLFDTHAHLDDACFNEDREEIISSLSRFGVGRLLVCGANMESSQAAIALASRLIQPKAIAAVGIHPSDAQEVTSKNLRQLTEWLSLPIVKALGEIGLDYYYEDPSREVQKAAFIKQLDLARALDARIIFHIRDAWGDFFSVMQSHAPRQGIMHCWSGSKESAARCLDLGFMLSFSGSLTFKNAANLREVAEYVPLDRLLIETDCPYLTPVPFRGKRNQPSYVRYTCQQLAEVKGLPPEEMAEITYENACRFFGISE